MSRRPAGRRGVGPSAPSGGQGSLKQSLRVLLSAGRDGDHRNSQPFCQALAADGASVGLHLVHHVDCRNHRNPQLQQLKGEIEVSLQVGSVQNVHHGTLKCQQIPSRHPLLLGIGPQGIAAGQIHHSPALWRGRVDESAFLLFYGHSRPVAHILAAAGEEIEESGLAAVGIARQRQKGEGRSRVSPGAEGLPGPFPFFSCSLLPSPCRRAGAGVPDSLPQLSGGAGSICFPPHGYHLSCPPPALSARPAFSPSLCLACAGPLDVRPSAGSEALTPASVWGRTQIRRACSRLRVIR